jgi:hypothetical protein
MIQTIFGSPVVFLKASNVEEIFSKNLYNETVEYLMNSDNKFIEHPFTRGGKICTTDLNSKIGTDPTNELNLLFEFLKKTALEYVHLFSDRPVKDLEFCNYWINLTFQGCEIKNHNDSNSSEKSLIVTFYPKAPPGGAELVFIHNSKDGEWVSDRLEKDLVRVAVTQGDIVIFDNFIPHAVDVHQIEDSRMCIATEFKILL